MMTIGVVAGKSGDAITSELHKFGFKVALICGKAGEAGYNDADIVSVFDLREKDKITEFFKFNNIEHVIIATGHRYALELTESLINSGISVNIDLEKVKVCKNKFLTSSILGKNGIPVLNQFIINENNCSLQELEQIVISIGMPCVLKSIKDIKEPQLFFNIGDLHDEIKSMLCDEEDVFIEQYKKGSDCTVIVANYGNNAEALKCIYWSKGKEDRLKGFEYSESYKLADKYEEQVLSIAKQAIETMGILGVSRVDFIVENGEVPYVLEINGIIVSGLRGTSYCAKIVQAGVNRAEKIVEAAMTYFGIECKKTPTLGVFCNSIDTISFDNVSINEYKVEVIEYSSIDKTIVGEVLPDLIDDFTNFIVMNNGSSEYADSMLWILMYVIRSNFDRIVNSLNGEEQKMLELVKDYLNID